MDYTLYVDGVEVTTNRKLAPLKAEADFWLENLNSFAAKITRGEKTYYKEYDDAKWLCMGIYKEKTV